MAHPQVGDIIRVHYTGRLEDGHIFDSSTDRGPLDVTIGGQRIITGVEEALKQMEPGEAKTVTIGPDQAYGQRRSDLMVDVDRTQFPGHIQPSVGQQLQIRNDQGQVTDVTVAQVSAERVTLDGNHPLAGKTLTFDLELVEIRGREQEP